MTARISVTIIEDTRPKFAQAVADEVEAMKARGMALAKLNTGHIDRMYRAEMEFAQT